MTSVQFPDGTGKKGRRKWGWVFVALCVLQALAFGSAYLTATSRSSTAFHNAYSLDVAKLRDESARTYSRAQEARRQADLYLGLLVFGSLLCLIGTALGFRRYK